MQVEGKKVLVIGAARSGVAAARFLAARGAIVALNDRKAIEEWTNEARALKGEGVGLLAGDVPMWLMDQIELVVTSPGVPSKNIPVRYMDRAGAEVIGEVELAARFLRGRIVAITGTNGKTTTTALVGELLRGAGLPVQVGGNIGTPLVSLVDSSRDDGWTVAEVSSYQLETIAEFHPAVAIVLNLMPDHMDRYESLTDYGAAKHRIFRNQQAGDVAILNADDDIVASWATGLRAHVTLFSVERELEEGVFLRGGREIVSRTRDGERVLLTRDEMQLRGLHNVQNVLAALAAGLACGASPASMRETVRNFRPVEHRLERVAEVAGVEFYNDSKATNVDAALKALEAFAETEGRIVLILGGRGKNAPYAPLAPLVARKARSLVILGEDAERIESELKDYAPVIRASDMPDAVRRAFGAAEPGDVVLLAPACASWDMFESFEHRGRVFKEEVGKIMNPEHGIQKPEEKQVAASAILNSDS
ncbi:MAG TPA: UDP-N-acetylmuramoyl-L-alanine--D-glutamate ligase [Pyrinomonadaceae bacterium]|nr:UDP-N-acetylmuramoyl-L-alanine--D-glutamate ligase [Pyrinomonadaceae bacterium]